MQDHLSHLTVIPICASFHVLPEICREPRKITRLAWQLNHCILCWISMLAQEMQDTVSGLFEWLKEEEDFVCNLIMESLCRRFCDSIILDQIVVWGFGGFSICFCFQEHCLYVNYTFLQKLSGCVNFRVSWLLCHNIPYTLMIMHYVMKNAYRFSKTTYEL